MSCILRPITLALTLLAAGCSGDLLPQSRPLVSSDAAQSAYVNRGNGIAEYAPGAIEPRLLAGIAQAQAGRLAVAPDGTIWFASYLPVSTNLFSYDPKTQERHAYANRAPAGVMAVSPHAALALATAGSGNIALYMPHRYLPAAVFRSREPVIALRYDRTGRLWIARAHVLERLDPGAARPRTIARADDARALALDERGRVYLVDTSGLRVFTPAGGVLERRALRMNSAATFAVDRDGNRYLADPERCDRAVAMVRVYRPGADAPSAQAGPYETIAGIAFDDRGRVYVNASTCPSDLRFPWEPIAHVDIFEPALARLIATREQVGGSIVFGPRAGSAPVPLEQTALRTVRPAAAEYRLFEDGRLEKRRRRDGALLWSRGGVRAFAVDSRSGAVIAETANGIIRLNPLGRALRAYPAGPAEALRLAPSGAFVTISRPPAGSAVDAARVTAYDPHGRRGGAVFVNSLSGVRLGAGERVIVGNIDEVRIFDPALRTVVAHFHVDGAIRSLTYDGRTGEIDAALLNGEIERLAVARATQFVPGSDGAELLARDRAGNLWTVSPAIFGGTQRLTIFAPGKTRPTRSVALPPGLRAAAVIPDGDGTAVLIEDGPERGDSGMWRVESDGRIRPTGLTGVRAVAFAGR